MSWILDSILGSDEPTPATRPIPKLPIIDDPQPFIGSPRSESLTRLIELAERDAAIEKIYGPEMLALMKNAGSPVEPSTSTFNGQTLLTPVPEHIADPRKINCQCSCPMCRSGSGCWNCQADPHCEFSSLSVLDELTPVDPQEHQQEMEQAAKRQLARIAENKVARHKKGLEPVFIKARNAIPYGYQPGVIAALNRVHDAAAQYCAQNLPA